MSVLRLERNRGKAEAVRHGLRLALADGAEIVGYIDADLATPVRGIQRLIGIMRACDKDVLIAARVALLGREIDQGDVGRLRPEEETGGHST
jgi:dolichyl-phosphate beta-glucosyltransferase